MNPLPRLPALLLALGLAALAAGLDARPARADREAGAARPLSLREALRLAVRRNPALAAAAMDLAIARANVLAQDGLDDFVLDASATWSENRREVVPNLGVQNPEFDDLAGALSLTRPLPTGGKLGLRLSDEYQRSVSVLEGTGGPLPVAESYAPALQLVFSHPLLRGIGVDVARAPRRRARAARDVARLGLEAQASSLLRDVVSAYWELVYSAEELRIRRVSVDAAREQLRIVRANIDVGKQPSSASAEVEVAVAGREDDALAAEQGVRERAVELRRMIGLEIGPAELDLRTTDSPDAALAEQRPSIEAEAALERALLAARERNPQLGAARAQGKAATIEVDVTENGLLPQLDLSASGGPAGFAANHERALRQLTGVDSYAVQTSLVFSQPLGRRAARGARDAAREGLRKAHLSEADIGTQIASAVARSASLVDQARRRLDALASVVKTADLDLDAEKARFAVGRSTNFDVLRRQEEVAIAQLRLMRAKTDYLRAAATLEALTGDILPRWGIPAGSLDGSGAGAGIGADAQP